MSSRRSRIAALQAIVVGLALIVVYLVFLRPDGDDDLFGVSAGPESERVVEDALGPAPGPGRAGRDTTAAGDPSGGRSGSGSGRGEGDRAEPPVLPIGTGAPLSPTDADPAEDQYQNTVGRLSAELE